MIVHDSRRTVGEHYVLMPTPVNRRPFVKWLALLFGAMDIILFLSCVFLVYTVLSQRGPIFGDTLMGITYVNQTNQPLRFYSQLSDTGFWSEGEVRPHSAVTMRRMIQGPTFRIQAERPDGEVVFDQTYLWSELRRAQGRVVVSSLEPVD